MNLGTRPLLSVSNLAVEVTTPTGPLRPLENATFDVNAGEVLGIVGESGSGKSTLGLALMGLLADATARRTGSVQFDGQDLLACSEREMQRRRGLDIAMVFQDPMTSLNPLHRIGRQVAEAVHLHDRHAPRDDVRRRVLTALEEVGLPEPGRTARLFPHQLSGGMRQRVGIAMALVNRPRLLIADEPTTALDVTTQADILTLLAGMQSELGTSILFVSHDLGVISQIAHRVLVMYAGRVVETAPAEQLFHESAHPYTMSLIASAPRGRGPLLPLHPIPGQPAGARNRPTGCPFHPRCAIAGPECTVREPQLRAVDGGLATGHAAACLLPDAARGLAVRLADPAPVAPEPTGVAPSPSSDTAATAAAPVCEVRDVTKSFTNTAWWSRAEPAPPAVAGVSLAVRQGSTLAVVGESGSGKTTLARCLLRLEEADTGELRVVDQSWTGGRTSRRRSRLAAQLVFQDPFGSLDPRMTVGESIAEPLRDSGVRGAELIRRVAEALADVGLDARDAARLPDAFSGGERQRVGIARAIVSRPQLLVLDEPVASLDVSIQAQIMQLLQLLKSERGLSYLFITHDLALVRQFADDVVIMRQGHIVERGSVEQIFTTPEHPYTQRLLAAMPSLPARASR